MLADGFSLESEWQQVSSGPEQAIVKKNKNLLNLRILPLSWMKKKKEKKAKEQKMIESYHKIEKNQDIIKVTVKSILVVDFGTVKKSLEKRLG